jgi:hypothetical protein
MIHEYTSHFKKKMDVKVSRSSYISSLLSKFNKFRKRHNEDSNNQTFDEPNMYNKNSSILSSNSEISRSKIRKAGKVNIRSKSILRERKQSNAIIVKNQSLPRLTAIKRTILTDVNKIKHKMKVAMKKASSISTLVKKIKPVKFYSNKARVEEDIFKWSVKRVNSSLEKNFNPYELKKQLFDSSEKNPMTKLRCKSVIPFHLQANRPPFKGDSD